MGCFRRRRWMSFFFAATFVYILQHYFIYEPDIQDSQIHYFLDKGQPLPGWRSMPPAGGVNEPSGLTVDTRGQEDSPPFQKVTKENSASSEGLSKSGEGEKSAPHRMKRDNNPRITPQETHAPLQEEKNNSNHGSKEGKKNQPSPPQKNECASTSDKHANSKHETKNATGTHSINLLKRNTTVGDLYKSGFKTPQEDLCPNNGRDLKILILTATKPDHEKHRNAIRQTWGLFASRKDVSLGFVVGQTSKPDVQAVIDKENERYGDIIKTKCVDHYGNMTFKTVAMLEWTKVYCSEVRYLLRTDDDMFINVPLLLAFIEAKSTKRRTIFGRLCSGWKPVRDRKKKYYVDTAIFSGTRYPDFVTGGAYLVTNDIVEDLYRRTLQAPFFELDDVLVTGMVGESLGIKRVGDSRFRNVKVKLADICKVNQIISIHMVKYDEQLFDMHKSTLHGKTMCHISKWDEIISRMRS